MGQISLQIPQSGQPFSTEGPKVASDMTTIQAVINGNLDDTNLASPNSSVRRLLLGAQGAIAGGLTAGNYLLVNQGQMVTSGANITALFPVWAGDSGLSSQPQDFQVANKTAQARIRFTLFTNATAPTITFTAGLYALTAFGGGANFNTVTFGSALAGSTIAIATPSASSSMNAESAAFALPAAAATYALGVNLSGTAAANCSVQFSAQMYAYNS